MKHRETTRGCWMSSANLAGGNVEHSVASSNACGEHKVYPCCVWSWAGGRQQDLRQLISEGKFRAAFTKPSGKAEGARTVQGLLEVSHVTAIVQAMFSVRDIARKKKSDFSVSLAPKQLSLVLARRPAGEPC